MNKRRDIILFGIQGSGKGTQARRLSADCGYTVFETGAELRRIASGDSPLSQRVTQIMNSGQLVSTDLIMDIVESFIRTHRNDSIIFDGVPRNMEQFKRFGPLLAQFGLETLAIHILLSREESIKRLRKRRVLEGRSDDTDAGIKKRVEIFFTDTMPVIECYRTANRLIEVDGAGSIDEVAKKIRLAIE